jgi:hypothetical protein
MRNTWKCETSHENLAELRAKLEEISANRAWQARPLLAATKVRPQPLGAASKDSRKAQRELSD